MNEKTLEASIFIYEWVFEIRLGEGDEALISVNTYFKIDLVKVVVG